MDKQKINRAIKLYREFDRVSALMLRHRKIMVALPKHKQKQHNYIISQVVMKLRNAKTAFNNHAKKLKPEELEAVHQAVYV